MGLPKNWKNNICVYLIALCTSHTPTPWAWRGHSLGVTVKASEVPGHRGKNTEWSPRSNDWCIILGKYKLLTNYFNIQTQEIFLLWNIFAVIGAPRNRFDACFTGGYLHILFYFKITLDDVNQYSHISNVCSSCVVHISEGDSLFGSEFSTYFSQSVYCCQRCIVWPVIIRRDCIILTFMFKSKFYFHLFSEASYSSLWICRICHGKSY